MSKIGKLEEVSDNSALIDGIWYDTTEVQKYMPDKVDIQVEYNADENNMLQFIREKKTFTRKGNSFQGKNFDRGKNTQSIIKQVIFKAAIEEHKLHPEKTLKQIYGELKAEYLEELK